ncbi:MAG: hypothetical protein ABL898_14740 [Hyphomicrobiaceae bacterium]|nr:hypothetical protein [Hyphomicrobiaceae bacterium]
MVHGAGHAKLIADLVAVLKRIPRGHVLAVSALSRHFRQPDRLLLTLLAGLSKSDGTSESDVPWHRVVMDGGALGRHADRSLHLNRLRADGLAVAPAGIVQDLARVVISDLSNLPQKAHAATAGSLPLTALDTPTSRSRGRLGQPKSSI